MIFCFNVFVFIISLIRQHSVQPAVQIVDVFAYFFDAVAMVIDLFSKTQYVRVVVCQHLMSVEKQFVTLFSGVDYPVKILA